MTIQPVDFPLCVPPDQVATLWPAVFPLIERAYAEVDEQTPDELLERFADGKMLLWVSLKNGDIAAVLVTALEKRPSGLCCRLVAAAGVGERKWAEWHQRIESYARAEGCVKLTAEGRPGWGRVLPGYSTKRLILEKRL